MGTSRRQFLGLTAAAVGSAAVGITSQASANASCRATGTLYLGTYTSQAGGGTGIGLASYDTVTGRLTSTGVLAGVQDPSFLILSPSGRNLYAVNEQATGGVTAVAVDSPGRLRVLNRQPNGGSAPCHLALVANGKYLLSANYSSGDLAVHPVKADGSLAARTDLVKHAGSAPHAHQVVQDPTGNYVLAVDLGTDSIYTYTINLGKLSLKSQATVKAGAGPRHLAFHPNGRYAYVANELDSTIVVCRYDGATGKVTPGAAQTTVPAGSPTNYPGEVIVSPDGRFVYLSNRGHNSVAVFAVESGGATLRRIGTPDCGGNWPRHVTLDPTGKLMFVSNQRSNNIATLQVDPHTGLLSAKASFTAPIPVCVLPG
ncbi:lactonase family protein [Kribbella sp. CA-293567]|uniref:lactonase family protein n=1 Tax=Kribbella sp. CA-293567 TaxID=3002436 RepID=UPI0022DCFA67|nr:lactonase family protein [Kribbella sp. CA-293567]WBQ02900.1 lactonase family protein [Kribbella sp. CA-293567]